MWRRSLALLAAKQHRRGAATKQTAVSTAFQQTTGSKSSYAGRLQKRRSSMRGGGQQKQTEHKVEAPPLPSETKVTPVVINATAPPPSNLDVQPHQSPLTNLAATTVAPTTTTTTTTPSPQQHAHHSSSLLAQLLMVPQHPQQPHHAKHGNHSTSSAMSSAAAAAILQLMSSSKPPPPLSLSPTLLWGTVEGNALIDATFSQQVGYASRLMKLALDAKVPLDAPRVAEVLRWFAEHNRIDVVVDDHCTSVVWRPCNVSSLVRLGVNILSIQDDASHSGTFFVAEHMLPMMVAELRSGRIDTDEGNHEDNHRTLMVALHFVRLLCERVSEIITDVTTNPSSPQASEYFGQCPQIVALTIDFTDAILRQLSTNRNLKHLSLFNWGRVLNVMGKQATFSLQYSTLNSTMLSSSSSSASPHLLETLERFHSIIITQEVLHGWYSLFHSDLVATTSLPTSLVASARPQEAITLLSNLDHVFRFGVKSTSEVALNLMKLIPRIIHRGIPKDVIRFLVVMTRWRQQVNIASDHLIAQSLEACQQALAHKKVYLQDAIAILTHLGRLRFPVPLELVDRIIDNCLSQREYLTIPLCVNLVSSLRRIVESDISTGAVVKMKGQAPPSYAAGGGANAKYPKTWETFRQGKLDYVLHLVLQRVQLLLATTPQAAQQQASATIHPPPAPSPNDTTEPLEMRAVAPDEDHVSPTTTTTTTSTPEVECGALPLISVNDALALVTSYADLNNTSSSFAMYRLMRPQLAPLFDSDEVPSLKVIATLLGALSSLKLAVTTTFEEEELVRQAESEAANLLGRCSELRSRQTINSAPLADVIPLLTCVVQILSEEKEALSRKEDDRDADAPPLAAASDIKELLHSLLVRATERCEAEGKGPQVGGLARIVARAHRQQLAPLEWLTPLMEAVVRCSVMSLSRVQPGDEPKILSAQKHATKNDLNVELQRVLMTGPHGGIAQHDVCAVIPLLSSSLDSFDDVPLPSLSAAAGTAAQKHSAFSMDNAATHADVRLIWMVTMQRMSLLAESVSARELRQWMHLLVQYRVLRYDTEVFQGLAKSTFTALCNAVCSHVMSTLQLQDIAAFVASMHSAERDCLANDDDRDDKNVEPDAPVDSIEANDNDVTLAAAAVTTIDDAMRTAWETTFTGLAQQATQCLRMCRPPRTLSVADVRWSVKILKGISEHLEGPVTNNKNTTISHDDDGDDGTEVEEESSLIPQRVAFLYELLPFLMRETSSLNAVDLSLALHAYAKGGIWNVGAMAPLLRSASDGLALAPVRPCLGLLHTMVKSGFIRKECIIRLTSSTHQPADVQTPKPDLQSAGARGSSEAMEHVATVLVRRLWSEISSPGGFKQLQPEKELLALVTTLAYFTSPPRPLFDNVMTELRQRVTHRTLTENASFTSALAPVALLSYAPLLRLGVDHVTSTSVIARQYVDSIAWRTALLRQPTNRILKTMSLTAASHLVVEPCFTEEDIKGLLAFLWSISEHIEDAAHQSSASTVSSFAHSLFVMEAFHRTTSGLQVVGGMEGLWSSGCVDSLLKKVAADHNDDISHAPLDYAAVLKFVLLLPSTEGLADPTIVGRVAAKFLSLQDGDHQQLNHPEVHSVRSVMGLIDQSKRVVDSSAMASSKGITTTIVASPLKKDLQQKCNVFMLWLARKPNVERIVWCLRVLCRQQPAVTEQLHDVIVALDHLLVSAWQPESRDTEAMMHVVALIEDADAAAVLVSLRAAHFIPRLPIVLGRLNSRAQREGSLGISYNSAAKLRVDSVLNELLLLANKS
ncbi:GPI-anchored surface protein, putative [Bodo saltans]|uniref:GPI-anchored surface protein, putative n=1 Tax=Bodo saltans TaxID=75058 RepID=A0A0S4IX48_BODSA|nr:GPI-anchored surface protein, putative [Bodo saltans]|eukprot:CUG06179.1 GPI-anchored surface protein, putative [Bodo saltans]